MSVRGSQILLEAIDNRIDKLASMVEQLASNLDTKEFNEAQRQYTEKVQFEVSWIGV